MIHICRAKITAWSNSRRFDRNNPFFYSIKKNYIKTGYIQIDFDEIFPIQSSEFIKTLKFGSNFEKNWKEKPKNVHFHLKMYFYR